METAVQGPEFTPPPEGGLLRSLGFAVLAHLLLVLALSVSVQWKRDESPTAVEAEIWSPTVQQAAPKPVEAPPPPPPPPAPVVEKQVVQPPAPPAPPVRTDADIAIERDKERAAQEKARKEEAERQRIAAERKRQEELARQEEAKREQAKQEQARREQARQEQLKQEQAKQELARQQQAKKAADDRKRQEQAKLRQKQDEERLAKLHEETIKRMQGLAGATGQPSATGTALRSSGPSDSYGGRVRARVKPNIVFTDNIAGNPSAEVDVRLAPDGTIVGRTLRKSSGVASWDEAVLRAIDRTEVLPRDIDGRVPSSMVLVFRPRD
jgi:colicin import membrane protein